MAQNFYFQLVISTTFICTTLFSANFFYVFIFYDFLSYEFMFHDLYIQEVVEITHMFTKCLLSKSMEIDEYERITW